MKETRAPRAKWRRRDDAAIDRDGDATPRWDVGHISAGEIEPSRRVDWKETIKEIPYVHYTIFRVINIFRLACHLHL